MKTRSFSHRLAKPRLDVDYENTASDFPVENESPLSLNLTAKDSELRQLDHALIRKANFVDSYR